MWRKRGIAGRASCIASSRRPGLDSAIRANNRLLSSSRSLFQSSQLTASARYAKVTKSTPTEFSQVKRDFKLVERNLICPAYLHKQSEEDSNLLWSLCALAIGALGVNYVVVHADSNSPVLQSIIPTFARVQDALASVGYKEAESFPQIVVLGVQSAGKSSILEMIVGEEFIPKGEGTVTKRPLILTLHNSSSDPTIKDKNVKYAEFPDFPQLGKLTNFKTVENIIRDNNKQFSSTPLRLEIYSPDVVDLRLVDLPGLIHNPTRDQPEDLRERIKDLCSGYIDNRKTVVLAISPGNQDLQTSEALRLARKVDAKGKRTISVLSKMDLVANPDLVALVDTIQKLPLRLGYVGVVARSKQQLQSGVTIPQALKLEEQFFASHPEFERNGIKVGTAGLAKELSRMLETQLQNSLAGIVDRLRMDLREVKKDRDIVSSKTPTNPKERDRLLLEEMQRFLRELLGASTVHDIKNQIAKQIYKTIHAECMKSIGVEEEKAGFGFWKKKPADEAPKFWEGSEDVEYRRWRDKIHNLVQRLVPYSDTLTYQVVELLRARVPESSEKLSHRPFLQDTIANATLKYLSQSYVATADHVKYLITLENNISYDPEKLEIELQKLSEAKNIDLDKDKQKTSYWPFGGGSKGNKDAIQKYGPIWTEAYLNNMAERLANNIYNALCVEILDKLEDQLRDLYVVELYGNDPQRRDALLIETPEIEKKRKELDAKVAALEKALQVLGDLNARQQS